MSDQDYPAYNFHQPADGSFSFFGDDISAYWERRTSGDLGDFIERAREEVATAMDCDTLQVSLGDPDVGFGVLTQGGGIDFSMKPSEGGFSVYHIAIQEISLV